MGAASSEPCMRRYCSIAAVTGGGRYPLEALQGERDRARTSREHALAAATRAEAIAEAAAAAAAARLVTAEQRAADAVATRAAVQAPGVVARAAGLASA